MLREAGAVIFSGGCLYGLYSAPRAGDLVAMIVVLVASFVIAGVGWVIWKEGKKAS